MWIVLDLVGRLYERMVSIDDGSILLCRSDKVNYSRYVLSVHDMESKQFLT